MIPINKKTDAIPGKAVINHHPAQARRDGNHAQYAQYAQRPQDRQTLGRGNK
jgi:hypothetical protein